MNAAFSGIDILGNIAILKFPEGTKQKDKKEAAKKVLSKSVTTVLEKANKVKGRLRTIKTRFLAGIRTKEALYKENSCLFKFNIEECYFSPRLSNERLELAKEIRKKDNILVMFAGVSPFPIVIAKLAKPKRVVSVELGRKCCKYGEENVRLNKLENVEILQGDVKNLVPRIARREKFDKILMTRPQLKDTFLKQAFLASKKNTIIYYYDFGKDLAEIIQKIEIDAKQSKKKIQVIKAKKAGEIAPYKYRFRIDFIVLN